VLELEGLVVASTLVCLCRDRDDPAEVCMSRFSDTLMGSAGTGMLFVLALLELKYRPVGQGSRQSFVAGLTIRSGI
jgi:hypothetical protein